MLSSDGNRPVQGPFQFCIYAVEDVQAYMTWCDMTLDQKLQRGEDAVKAVYTLYRGTDSMQFTIYKTFLYGLGFKRLKLKPGQHYSTATLAAIL